MIEFNTGATFTTGLSLFLAVLMAQGGIHKLRHRVRYARIIDAYALLPSGSGGVLVVPLAVFECVGAAMILVPTLRQTGALLLAALILAYTVAIGITLLRGINDIDCGCDPLSVHSSLSPWLLPRNLTVLACVLVVGFGEYGYPHGLGQWIGASGILLLGLLLYNGFNCLLLRDASEDDN